MSSQGSAQSPQSWHSDPISGTHDMLEGNDPQAIKAVLKRAEISKVSRRVQSKLALASYKAQRGWQNLKFENIEPQLQESIKKQLLETQISESSGAADLNQLREAALAHMPLIGLNGHIFKPNGNRNANELGYSLQASDDIDDSMFKTPSKKRKVKIEHDVIHSLDRHKHKKERKSEKHHHQKSSPLERQGKKKKKKLKGIDDFNDIRTGSADLLTASDFATDSASASEFANAAAALASLQQPSHLSPPRTPRTPPPNFGTDDAAQIMLFMAQSPSPARTRTGFSAYHNGSLATPSTSMQYSTTPSSPIISTNTIYPSSTSVHIPPATPPRGSNSKLSSGNKDSPLPAGTPGTTLINHLSAASEARNSFPTTPCNFSFADYLNVTPSPAAARPSPANTQRREVNQNGPLSRRKLNFEGPLLRVANSSVHMSPAHSNLTSSASINHVNAMTVVKTTTAIAGSDGKEVNGKRVGGLAPAMDLVE